MSKHSTHVLRTKAADQAGTLSTPYPRPQLVRDSFLSLDGDWSFSVTHKGEGLFCGSIRVPFPPESALSGVERRFPQGTTLCYERDFTLPEGFGGMRVILHVGATDQIASVSLNGQILGTHRGGYLPFSFDITDALQEGKNKLQVKVIDELDGHILPYGKQREDRGGMWYTPISGIWQSVWLESVPSQYVRSLRIDTDENGATIRAEGIDEAMVVVTTPHGLTCVKMRDGEARVELDSPRLWSPEDPYLYRFKLICEQETVRSYFACRTVTVGQANGLPRLLLNGKPYFFHGLLDQGYFPDGIFTPAHPSLYEQDILFAKSLGFNTLRKHIKIEPEQFYYDCDRLGMIVFQDMVNNGDYSFLRDTALPTIGLKRRNDKRLHRCPAARAAFLSSMEETVKALYNHPSICYWTIFNEGWGQFDSEHAYRTLRALDSSRPIDTASGWFKTAHTDVESPHVYFKPVKIKPAKKPILLSEFGGYSLPFKEHAFNSDKVYGYRKFEDTARFQRALCDLYEKEILPIVKKGLCGAIYTQLCDVEDEVNGLITYDRKVKKVNAAIMCEIARRLQEQIQ